jgi:hypothetical protein
MKWPVVIFSVFHGIIFIGCGVAFLFLPIPYSGLARTPGNVTYTWWGQPHLCSDQGNVTGEATIYIQLVQPTECLPLSTIWNYQSAFWFGLALLLIYGLGSLIVMIYTWKYYHQPTIVSRISIPAITEISVVSEMSESQP